MLILASALRVHKSMTGQCCSRSSLASGFSIVHVHIVRNGPCRQERWYIHSNCVLVKTVKIARSIGAQYNLLSFGEKNLDDRPTVLYLFSGAIIRRSMSARRNLPSKLGKCSRGDMGCVNAVAVGGGSEFVRLVGAPGGWEFFYLDRP